MNIGVIIKILLTKEYIEYVIDYYYIENARNFSICSVSLYNLGEFSGLKYANFSNHTNI